MKFGKWLACLMLISVIAGQASVAQAVIEDVPATVAAAKGSVEIAQLIIDNPGQGADIVEQALLQQRVIPSSLVNSAPGAGKSVVQSAIDAGIPQLEANLIAQSNEAFAAFVLQAILSPPAPATIH